ncbi:ATP-binding protein [Pseudalkalibacillus sp. A8]|uniref:Dph6-related ATP pyrophosphatase n=1 Tax=Pseudalkalibacillus sp. A8 TaxID=3382641 RepID=UPI0038B459B5
MVNRSVLFWSGGKDCMMALDKVLESKHANVAYLFTTYDEMTNRVPFHGIHIDLIKAQANSLRIPLLTVPLPHKPSNTEYQDIIHKRFASIIDEGLNSVIFGDIFLEDLHVYRESLLNNTPLEASFPLWGESTSELTSNFLSLGYKAVICGIDTEALDENYLGKDFDEEFLLNLPSYVDPCGENGEFHTFTYTGPLFKETIHHEANLKPQSLFGKYKYIDLD